MELFNSPATPTTNNLFGDRMNDDESINKKGNYNHVDDVVVTWMDIVTS